MSHDIALLVATSIQESLKVKQALLDDKDTPEPYSHCVKAIRVGLEPGAQNPALR